MAAASMHGPNESWLLAVALPATMRARPSAAASTNPPSSPATNADAPAQPRYKPRTPESFTSPQPIPAGLMTESAR